MKSLEELSALRDKTQARLGAPGRIRVTVGLATCGIAAGASPVFEAAAEAAREMSEVFVARVGCIGACRLEPMVEVWDEAHGRTTYVHMTPDRVKRVMREHVAGGSVVGEFTVGAAMEE